ncbi:MAG: hypothetical protein ABJJ37_00785 [Roseibium sp.]
MLNGTRPESSSGLWGLPKDAAGRWTAHPSMPWSWRGAGHRERAATIKRRDRSEEAPYRGHPGDAADPAAAMVRAVPGDR